MSLIETLPEHSNRPAGAPLALEGLRIIDFSHFVAGPFCTLILADFGGDVIKVENAAHGDDMRNSRPPEIGGEGTAFLWGNRNKRSIALDLAVAEGREIARKLIASADILVENFSPGVMSRFGLDYETVAADNPGLIYCSISAYGQDGELARRNGFDPIAQAASGLMSINGMPDSPPVVIGTPLIDITCGMMASNAILAAIVARHRIGRGQRVEIAMFDQAITMLAYNAVNALVTGENPVRGGNSSKEAVPVGVFEASDGPMFLCCANDRTYRKLMGDVVDRPDLAADPRLQTMQGRAAHADLITPLLTAIFATRSRADWLARMYAAGVPAAPVATVVEAVTSDEIRERGLLSRIEHPSAGTVPNVALPFRMSATPMADPRPSPMHGQHRDEVLEDALGLDTQAIAAYRAAGAFGAAARDA